MITKDSLGRILVLMSSHHAALLFMACLLALLAACRGGPPPTPTGMGTVELRLTDAPAQNGQSVLVTIRDVEIRGSGDWQPLVREEARVDLVALVGIETALGTASVPAGRYQQLRFRLADPVLAHEGTERQVTLGTERPVLAMDAMVVHGRTTIVVLDIDAFDSFEFTGEQPVFEAKAKVTSRPG